MKTLATADQSVDSVFMPIVSSRFALLSFASALAVGSPIAAQEAQAPPSGAVVGRPAALNPALGLAGLPPVEAAALPIPEVWAPAPRDAEDRSAYGLYLAGRNAMSQGEGGQAAALLTAVEALTPEQPMVREQAFTAVLLSGDLDDAARITPTGEGVSPVIREAGRLVSAVQSFARGDARAAAAALKAEPIRSPHARAGLLVQPWIAAAAGDWDAALAAPTPAGSDAFSLLLRFQRAQLLEIRGRHDEAEVEYAALAAEPRAQIAYRLGYGGFLERRDRRDEAVAAYDRAIAAGANDAPTASARARADSGGRPPALASLREGAAGALTLAAALTSSDAPEFAAVYVRLALNIDPSDQNRLLLGTLLAQARLEAAARDAFAQVGSADAPAYAAARTQMAASFARDEQHEAALAEFQRAAAAVPDNPQVAYFLAGQLVQLGRHDEALALLNGPVLNTPTQGAEVRFMRGAAYESTGRIPEAEAQLWAALQARPDEPAFLNYLGYLWVDSGARVAEGAAMIARAHAADPADGNIQDSLGWAQYRQGQYDVAVSTLEEAVAKEPANAEINDHLGDAYWQVGRKREAGFQWTRVLTLAPDAERRAEVEIKLSDGLTPPTPVSSGDQP